MKLITIIAFIIGQLIISHYNQTIISQKIKLIKAMKLRAQRVHFMGSSNRAQQSTNPNNSKINDVFESSYIKSQSCYYKTSSQIEPSSDLLLKSHNKTNSPFLGTHNELQTVRFDKTKIRKGKQPQFKLQSLIPTLDFADRLNRDIDTVRSQFENKQINMFKLKELKRTFVKNNHAKRYLKQYFLKYANQNAEIGVSQLKKIVKEYGYDVGDDEAKLIIKLTNNQKDKLDMPSFIDLMTKENAFFKTLKFRNQSSKNVTQARMNEKVHLVLRNKFVNLKEAFKIYRMRGQQVDEEKFNYVMKKLDINDLVLSKKERKQVFEKFKTDDDHFNVEGLLCSLVQQQSRKSAGFPPKLSDFEDNLKYNQQKQGIKNNQITNFNFKTMTNFEYEKLLHRAKEVVTELRKLNQNKKIIDNLCTDKVSKHKLRQNVEMLMQQEGINFSKQDYDCFIGYIDYNSQGVIAKSDLKKFVVDETSKEAEDRIERRVRVPPPEHKQSNQQYNQKAALESLQKIKSKKLNPQMKILFKQFDKDKDGYLSRQELKQQISNLNVLQNWQLTNLLNYIDSNRKGYVDYNQFTTKYTGEPLNPSDSFSTSIKNKSHSDWLNSKRTFIKNSNQFQYNVPTKYSAWPERLHEHDLSMIQPPKKAGQFMSEDQRFNSSEKHMLGQQYKAEKSKIYENKLRRLAAWNQINQERIQNTNHVEQSRHQANNYSLRLTKQNYEALCHLK